MNFIVRHAFLGPANDVSIEAESQTALIRRSRRVCRALRRLVLPWLLALHAVCAGAANLAGGPMAGPATSARARVWLMTDAPAQVQLEYWPHGQPDAVRRSAPVAVGPERGLTARVDLDGLRAATRYAYRVLLDGTPVELGELHAFTTAPADPAAPRELVIATGSCNYVPDPPYEVTQDSFGAGFEIFDTIAARRPDMMLWLGDSIYYRDDDLAPADGAAARGSVARAFPPASGSVGKSSRGSVCIRESNRSAATLTPFLSSWMRTSVSGRALTISKSFLAGSVNDPGFSILAAQRLLSPTSRSVAARRISEPLASIRTLARMGIVFLRSTMPWKNCSSRSRSALLTESSMRVLPQKAEQKLNLRDRTGRLVPERSRLIVS